MDVNQLFFQESELIIIDYLSELGTFTYCSCSRIKIFLPSGKGLMHIANQRESCNYIILGVKTEPFWTILKG